MKTLYIDCFSGASGDMLMGALLDVGAGESTLREGLRGLGLEGEYVLRIRKVLKSGIACTKVDVLDARGHEHDQGHDHGHGHERDPDQGQDHEQGHVHDHDHVHENGDAQGQGHAHDHSHAHGPSHGPAHRGLGDILERIRGAGFPHQVEAMACAVFTRLGEAEAAIHGTTPDEVHFHEVGGVDAMIDIVGVCLLIHDLAPERVVVSPIAVGSGRVKCAHGILPVPAPATAALLRGAPTYAGPIAKEMCTPTGAALLMTLADAFGAQPAMRVTAIGYGAGTREAPMLNAVRVLLGDEQEDAWGGDEIRVLECHLDDITGEDLGLLVENAMAAGALDAAVAPLLMKKGRPGHAVTVLVRPQDERALTELLLDQSPTWGIRRTIANRAVLPREIVQVETAYGPVGIKRAGAKLKPEFDHLKRAAQEHGVPVDRVRAAALAAYERITRGW